MKPAHEDVFIPFHKDKEFQKIIVEDLAYLTAKGCLMEIYGKAHDNSDTDRQLGIIQRALLEMYNTHRTTTPPMEAPRG